MQPDAQTSPEKILVATRGSALALQQARIVASSLSAAFPQLDFLSSVIKTRGDKLVEKPLFAIGGKGVFVKEIEESLLRGKSRLAVHSMKDLPIDLPCGLCLASTPGREDFRDVLISRDMVTLQALRHSAIIGTGSPRRKAQLLAFRPDLRIEHIRGNLDTRVAKLRGTKPSGVAYDAIVVAAAGCLRAGYAGEIAEYLPPELMLPAAGQGAIAIECREDDREAVHIARAINDPTTFAAVQAERALVKFLGGGCEMPIAALATAEGDRLRLRGAVLSPDGKRAFRAESVGLAAEPESLAKIVGEELFRLGASELIREGKLQG